MIVSKDSHRRASALATVFLMCLAAFVVAAWSASAEPYENSGWIGSISQSRYGASVVMGDDGQIYVIGGRNTGGVSQDSVQIFNISSKQTSYGQSIPVGVVGAAAVKWNDGRIFVLCGYNGSSGAQTSNRIYNPVTDAWDLGMSVPKALVWASACLGPDSRIYLFGGYDLSNPNNSTLIYNVTANSWTYGKDLLNPRWGSAAVMTATDSIWLVGGGNWGGASNLVEVYNPLANSWSYGKNLTMSRCFPGVVYARNGYMYAMGGSSSAFYGSAPESIVTERTEVATTDPWETSPFTPDWARSSFGTVADSYGRIFIVSGWDGSSALADVHMIVVSDTAGRYQLAITSPTDGSVVSDVVTVEVQVVNWASPDPWNALMGVDLLVDGIIYASQSSGWSWSFPWDTSGLADGSSHTLTVRGYHWDAKVVEDSVTVIVWSDSVAQHVADLEDEIAATQAKIAALQAQLAAADGNVTTILMTLAALGATFADLQTQLDDMQEQVDRIENKADTAGTYAMINVVLVIVILVLLALMFVMSRRKP